MAGTVGSLLGDALRSVRFEMRTWLRMLVPGSAYVAPYYPTPDAVIERMLNLVEAGRKDCVFDLGCGDGRVLLAAARRGASGVGYELDPTLYAQACEAVRAAGLEQRLRIVQADAASADVSHATVVALYLSEHGNRRLLLAVGPTLRPGTKVVSFTFPVNGWEAHLKAHDLGDNLPVFVYHAPGKDGGDKPVADPGVKR